MSYPSSPVSTGQRRKERRDLRVINQGRKGQKWQEQQDEMRGKDHTIVEPMELVMTAALESYQDPAIVPPQANKFVQQLAAGMWTFVSTVQCLVEAFTQASSALFERSHSRRAVALGHLCRVASLWALLRLPTAAAAFELEKVDVATGYGTIPIGTTIFMTTVFVRKLRHSVQGHRWSLGDSARGRRGNRWYMVWVIAVLLAMAIILAPAISDFNHLTAVDPVTEL